MARAVRWQVVVPTALLAALLVLVAETSGLAARFPFRPNLLWCLAVLTALRTTPASAFCVFTVCGLVRDAVLGPRMGSAAIAFTLCGWFALSWRMLASVRGWSSEALVAGLTAFLVALIKYGLDYGALAHKLVYRIVFLALGDGFLTAVVYVPVAVLVSAGVFRPWRN